MAEKLSTPQKTSYNVVVYGRHDLASYGCWSLIVVKPHRQLSDLPKRHRTNSDVVSNAGMCEAEVPREEVLPSQFNAFNHVLNETRTT